MARTRVEWSLACDCAEDEKRWENFIGTGDAGERVARGHVAVLRAKAHPVKLLRRTVTVGDWQEVT